jgi:outer membrane protein
MRTSRLFFLVLLLSFNVAAAEVPTDTASAKLTLRQSVELGLRNNPGVLQVAERLHEADDISRLSISKSLPTANGSLTYNRQKDAATNTGAKFGGDPYNYYSGKIDFSQVILQRGYISALYAGGQERDIRRMDFEIARRDLTFTIIQAFYRVLLYSRQYDTLRRAEEVHRQSLETTNHRYTIGRGRLVDLLQVKTQLALLAPKIEKAANDMKTAAAQLSIALGNQEFKALEVTGRLNPPSLKAIEEQTKNLKGNVPELSRVELIEKQFENTMVTNLAKHWPQLTFNGTVSRQGYKKSDLTSSTANLWSLGFTVNVPLFSGLSYFFEKGSLQSQELQLKYQEQQLRNQFSSDQVKTLQDLRSAESVIQSSETAFNLAQQAVKEAKREYKLATIDYVQFLTTEQNLIDAEQALDQGRYDYLNLLSKYFSAYGFPPEVLVDSLDS